MGFTWFIFVQLFIHLHVYVSNLYSIITGGNSGPSFWFPPPVGREHNNV